MITTTAFSKIAEMRKRVRVVQGGTSASKTYSILQILITIAKKQKEPFLISIVSESLPHLKKGAMRDFLNILKNEGIYDEKDHNKTDNIYRIGKTEIEFFSVDQESKVRGARRDVLFMNEANNMNLETFNQLEVRTKRVIFIDYNPTNEFWVHDEVLPHDDSSFLILTYQDNEQLDETIIRSIEKRKPKYDSLGNIISGNENWWRVYGEGQTGVYEGLIFEEDKNWKKCDKIPQHAKLIGRGQDYGYSNDPSALVAVYFADGEYYVQEEIYEKGLTNLYNEKMTEEEKRETLQYKYETLNIEKDILIIGDSAEPKTIEDFQRLGYSIRGAVKGRDSITNGIDFMKSLKINVTKDSTNLIKEFRSYCWDTDKNGKPLNIPIDDWNHAIDALRYILSEKLKTEDNIDKELERYKNLDLSKYSGYNSLA